MPQSPKKSLTPMKLKEGLFGTRQRIKNALESFDENMVFPKPVEYEDIDRAVLDFVRDNIHLMSEKKEAPTFTLFSNQRFSEYSQTWEHTDEEGNLLMDFKTVNREANPSWGDNQGNGMYNIPGDRRYTIQMKEVLDDNGTECYEVYSMTQPLTINLVYTINYITADWSKLNNFNIQLHQLFKSIQCYINPNGWYMPMVLQNISDETEYALDNRKIYIQSALITVKGIIVPASTYKIDRIPKRVFFNGNLDKTRVKANVIVDENETETKITIDFVANTDKVEFNFDDIIKIDEILSENIRDFTIYINDEKLQKPREGFIINENDNVRIRIKQIEKNLPSTLFLVSNKSGSGE